MSFIEFSKDLSEGLSDEGPAEHEHSVLVEELKIGCTMAMLQCLDRPHRLAYILGEILDLSGPEAAVALKIDAATFRKRLERARTAIVEFSKVNCGLLADNAPCRCHRRVQVAMRIGRVHAGKLQFADQAVSFNDVKATISAADAARAVLQIHRSNQPNVPTTDLLNRVVNEIEARGARAESES